MGYSICMGTVIKRHHERRTCDGCDECPDCEGITLKKLRCEYCCGDLYACPKCEPSIRKHISEADRKREIARGQGVLLTELE